MTARRKWLGLVLAATLLAFCPALFAGQHGHGPEGHGHPHGNPHARKGSFSLQFSEHEQGIIRDYFADTSNLPPGLAKRGGNLPPGLEKQLERNGHLPPGLEKRLRPFPEALSRQLPPLPEGYTRQVLGNRALVLDVSNRIIDVMFIWH